jgi:hypothetical protein
MKEDHRDQRSMRWAREPVERHDMAGSGGIPCSPAVTIGLLALGIGANTAMFSIVDATC